MPMTPAQLAAVKSAVIADPTANAYRTAGDSYGLQAWLNAATTTDAWRTNIPARDLVDALNIASFDNITAGKRQGFDLMLRYEPIDASKPRTRAGLADIFAVTGAYTDNSQLPLIAAACTEKATKAQSLLPYTTPAAMGGVTAIRRSYTELVSREESDRLVN